MSIAVYINCCQSLPFLLHHHHSATAQQHNSTTSSTSSSSSSCSSLSNKSLCIISKSFQIKTPRKHLSYHQFNMQFSKSFILAALPFLAAAAPAPDYKVSPLPQSSGPVGLIATHSASPIHLQSINASGQAFWIGKETSSYCPLTDQSLCPPGKDTSIIILGNEAHPGTASMSKC